MLTRQDVLDTLSALLDPDVGINIVDLGLVETVEVGADTIGVGLIMTTPACPQTSYLQEEADRLLTMRAGPGVRIDVAVLDAPFWSPDRLSPSARTILGWHR